MYICITFEVDTSYSCLDIAANVDR